MAGANPYPIVLAHGIARFDILRQLRAEKSNPAQGTDDSWHYFKGIKSHLEAHGFTVAHANVSFAASVDLRAQELAEQVREVLKQHGADKVHLIAHSMGGLDARHLIVDVPGMAEKVASLTTIGTPHLGTTAADTALELGGNTLIEKLKPFMDLSGYRDLSTQACAQFNRRAEASEAANKVRYQTYSSTQELKSTLPALHAAWLWIKAREGDNDGLVSARSQAWVSELRAANGGVKKVAQHRFPLPADHVNQLGWWLLSNWNANAGHASVTEQMKSYEGKIKEIYLQMARGLNGS